MKNLQGDKENVSKKDTNARRSLGTQKQALNTSGNSKLNEKEDINELNNQFTGYIDYVRKIEASNENLKNEKQTIIESYKCSIDNLESTYADEIKSLRKALDDVSTNNATLVIESKVLFDENEKLRTKLRNESNALIVLKKEYSELEESRDNYRRKNEKYEQLQQDHNELTNENANNVKELKLVQYKHAELESRFVTLQDEIEFYKRVNSNAKTTFANEIAHMQNVIVDNTESNAEEIAAIRMELTEEFEQYKENLETMFEEKLENITKINDKSSAKCNNLYNEVKMLKATIGELNNEIFEKDNQIVMLNKRIANHSDLLNRVNVDHENYIKDIQEENTNYKKELESKIVELTNAVNEKIAIEKELSIFKSVLVGEQSRCNIGEASSNKKRQKSVDDYDISAWSKDRVKIFCDDQYNGKFIQLFNDSDTDQNINEWKVEISSNNIVDLYTFPDRILKARSILKLWNCNEEVSEDGDNVSMNISLPVSDHLTCKLTNDMDELEAGFELREVGGGTRKILKSKKKNNGKEGCSIM